MHFSATIEFSALPDRRQAVGDLPQIAVRHGHEFQVGGAFLDQVAGAVAGADQADADPIVGPGLPGAPSAVAGIK